MDGVGGAEWSLRKSEEGERLTLHIPAGLMATGADALRHTATRVIVLECRLSCGPKSLRALCSHMAAALASSSQLAHINSPGVASKLSQKKTDYSPRGVTRHYTNDAKSITCGAQRVSMV